MEGIGGALIAAALEDAGFIGAAKGFGFLVVRGERANPERLLVLDGIDTGVKPFGNSLGIRGNGAPTGRSSGLGLTGKPGLFGADDKKERSFRDPVCAIRGLKMEASDPERSLCGGDCVTIGRGLDGRPVGTGWLLDCLKGCTFSFTKAASRSLSSSSLVFLLPRSMSSTASMSSYSDSESASGCSMIVPPICPRFSGAGGGFLIGCGILSCKGLSLNNESLELASELGLAAEVSRREYMGACEF